jgi:protocatechuate 3,4-dioxygenase beta subunit
VKCYFGIKKSSLSIVKYDHDSFGYMKRLLSCLLISLALMFSIPWLISSISFDLVSGSVSSSPPQPSLFPDRPELPATQIKASTNQSCSLTPSLIEVEGTPQQTEGPYFVDDMPSRSDLRTDTSDGKIQEGIPLNLILHVYGLKDKVGSADGGPTCTPLKGPKVDIWEANSQGVYSGVQSAGTRDNNFLRGNQLTDENGTVHFITIYPGWYEGRAIHIHVKVRASQSSNEPLEWTSQFYLNNSVNDKVHTQAPYSNHGPVDLTNEEDFIYEGPSTDGMLQAKTGEHLMLELVEDGRGYTGTFNIVLNASQAQPK